jgi:chromosome segregation ATPase
VTKLSQPREQDGKFGNVPGAGDDAPEESDESADILPGKLKSAKARVGKARDADRKRVDESRARLADAKSERKSIAKEAAGVDKAIGKELGPEKVEALDELEAVGSKSQRIGKHIDDAEAGKRAVSPEGAAVAANLPKAKRQKAELDARAGELKAVIGEPSPRALELRERQSRLQLEADDLDNEIEKHSGIIKGAAKREKAFDALDAALDSGDRAAIAKAQERAADLIGDSDESALDSEEFAGLAPDGDLFGDD